MSFSHDDGIEEPPPLSLRHSTGSAGDEPALLSGAFATTDFAESALPAYVPLAAPHTTKKSKAAATTAAAAATGGDDHYAHVGDSDDSDVSDGDGDNDNDADENTEDTTSRSDGGGKSSSGVMRADDGAGVLESVASLKWSTGEIQPPVQVGDDDDAAVFDGGDSVQASSSKHSHRSGESRPDSVAAAAPAVVDADANVSWRIDPHEVQMIKEIGRGSFGAVYTAKLRGSDVAVKKLYSTTSDAGILADFSAEVSIMTKLRHPHVLLFMGASSEPGALFIVFEYMPRGSVYDLLHDPVLGARLTFAAKMDIARQTAQGMNWLHLSKPPFLHRDLKTGNLLVDNNWTVKVCDFGLSQVKKATPSSTAKVSADSDGTLHSNPVLLGTPLWMAPEILSGASAEPDESADVYAYGIVLWEIITRQEPYPEVQSFDELVELVVVRNERPLFPPDTPRSLIELAARCWHRSRSQRPPFAEILESLTDVIIDGVLIDQRACTFWKRRLYEQDTVPWETFRDNLADELHLKLPKDGIAWRCLLALIAVAGGGAEAVQRDKHGVGSGAALRRAMSHSISPTGSNASSVAIACAAADKKDEIVVHMSDFGRLLQYMGPLDAMFVENIEAIVRKRWFWGDVPTAESEALVQKCGKGSFLVRFSTSDVGGFAITVLSKGGRTKHFRIGHKRNEFTLGQQTRSSIFELVDAFGKELFMIQPCSDHPFSPLYRQTVVNTAQMSAYFDADLTGASGSYALQP
jgi:serine/threonine protein kinase